MKNEQDGNTYHLALNDYRNTAYWNLIVLCCVFPNGVVIPTDCSKLKFAIALHPFGGINAHCANVTASHSLRSHSRVRRKGKELEFVLSLSGSLPPLPADNDLIFKGIVEVMERMYYAK